MSAMNNQKRTVIAQHWMFITNVWSVPSLLVLELSHVAEGIGIVGSFSQGSAWALLASVENATNSRAARQASEACKHDLLKRL